MKQLVIWICLALAGVPSFEVASIKPSDPDRYGPMFIGMSADNAIVRYRNITLRDCIRGAYRVRSFQVVGPAWLSDSRFEITATLPKGVSRDQIPEMLQVLLADRFKLEIRREKREQSVYVLLPGNEAPKLKPARMKSENTDLMALGPDGKPRPGMMYTIQPGGITLIASSATLASLTDLLSRFMARPVLDMTGIEGQFEFNLNFAPEVAPPGADSAATSAEPAPSLAAAFKQYGLRLETRKEPVEMLIVTRIEKLPTEN